MGSIMLTSVSAFLADRPAWKHACYRAQALLTRGHGLARCVIATLRPIWILTSLLLRVDGGDRLHQNQPSRWIVALSGTLRVCHGYLPATLDLTAEGEPFSLSLALMTRKESAAPPAYK